eukprot:CCRYP_008376-RA/>CCRYP_008376-RA protein AED:0.19 eAED:0.19 QI:0/-1/0/1/-1/1/1/0/255
MRIRIILPVLSILIASTQASGGLKGAASQNSHPRSLEYNWNNNDDNYQDYNLTTGSSSNSTSSMHDIQGMVINQVQQYKAAAESKAWEFYQSAPSDWTENQWDLVWALLGGLLISCCFVSVCCAYCCIYRDHDDSLSVSTTQYKKRMLNHRLNRYRSRYNDRRYDDRDDETVTIESQSTYEAHSPMSYASTVVVDRRDEKRESLLKKSGASKHNRSVRMAEGTKKKSSSTTSRKSTPKHDDASSDEPEMNYKMHP